MHKTGYRVVITLTELIIFSTVYITVHHEVYIIVCKVVHLTVCHTVPPFLFRSMVLILLLDQLNLM